VNGFVWQYLVDVVEEVAPQLFSNGLVVRRVY
jgi:hypothetical protein